MAAEAVIDLFTTGGAEETGTGPCPASIRRGACGARSEVVTST